MFAMKNQLKETSEVIDVNFVTLIDAMIVMIKINFEENKSIIYKYYIKELIFFNDRDY